MKWILFWILTTLFFASPGAAASSCQTGLSTEAEKLLVFPLGKRETALFAKAVSVRERLLQESVARRRLDIALPEYGDDFRRLQTQFTKIKREISAWQRAIQTIDNTKTRELIEREKERPNGAFSFDYNVEFFQFDLHQTMIEVEKLLFANADTAPTYLQLLIAQYYLPVFSEISLLIRMEFLDLSIEDSISKPFSASQLIEAVKNQPLTALENHGLFADIIFSSYPLDPPSKTVEYLRSHSNRVEIFAKAVESSKKYIVESSLYLNASRKVLGLPLFGTKPFSMNLGANLAALNIGFIQVADRPYLYHDVDGSDLTPVAMRGHDEGHVLSFVYENPARAIALIRKMQHRLSLAKRKKWLPLLVFLVFFQKHEYDQKIVDIPRWLDDFANPEQSHDQFLEKILKRVEDPRDLGSPELTNLYNSSWPQFLQIIQ